ncbi:hypothetical protein A2334_03220 [Candidatus Roizmanbacteria bacterium RIFOXYB2_FULL_38_10]|uniref:ATP-grasp domain-containing protein n=1 Tax=Candidatus Roizmanbacteria bacterium RIFOXYD1_FULL_38_12 TaxID=1802093 RepID=A0A1F7L196_9BACT|nr:MAG: hypothetical protein A3K47_03630 [Candidatus Roizmanbacteria bacterium RIFOXYA2_FULL_38_14]OGK63853.1 MAG: hypothetical protein A3K27_03630 [Candidatus Roizmanbacteria bacterium RIFOXYA1_FULL_37_12]OGK65699.1 MAG: hypothetical protein A3K38_03630 [Candidatus Roizmanbacteria bacterium RIFOXYB1_FULL_40_23]OGK67415.1 MAG: hypothetical protein A2334_03220 [Candidatus Roizmanbacteria bacterium RIFOXYB2_FULL_38_10]OGK70104.1 MAG: hypothetical protein A3K21_03635 [Candidatus Roizmanbacteria ba
MKSDQEDKPPSKPSLNNLQKKKKNGYGSSKDELLVYVYNVVEDEWSYISTITDKEERKKEIERDNNTAECYLFANADEDEFVYISPKPITPNFKKYFQNLVGAKKIEILVPKKDTGLICKDLYNDMAVFHKLVNKAKRYKRLTIVSYAASPQLYELKERLEKRGLNVYIPEAPTIDCSWTVNFFGSKSGIRQLAQQSSALEPDFIMPEGLICVGKLDAARIAANKFIKDNGVVIKTNKGSSGNGVLIFRDGQLPKDYKKCERSIYSYLKQDEYWERYPIIIEDLIPVNFSNGASSFPNIEFKIQKSGKIDMLYFCTMKITEEGEFYGLDMHEDVINERLAARIIDTGYYIAERYSAEGYRGHFDIDMIATKYNQVFVNESNTRNTGGTDVYKVALELIGRDFFSDSYVISRSKFPLHNVPRPSFPTVLKKLQPLLFNKKTKEGIVISSENIIKQKELIYIIFGNSKRRAYQIEQDMRSLLH